MNLPGTLHVRALLTTKCMTLRRRPASARDASLWSTLRRQLQAFRLNPFLKTKKIIPRRWDKDREPERQQELRRQHIGTGRFAVSPTYEGLVTFAGSQLKPKP